MWWWENQEDISSRKHTLKGGKWYSTYMAVTFRVTHPGSPAYIVL